MDWLDNIYYIGISMWTTKYKPNKLSGFVGNGQVVKQVIAWANEWNAGEKQKPLLLHGNPGIGKTLLAHILTSEMEWDIFELNASDFRTKDTIQQKVAPAALNSSFSGNLRLILMDEIDGLQGNVDSGGMAAIAKIVRESKNPIIFTANDIYAKQSLATIRTLCTLVPMKKVDYRNINNLISKIYEKEEISADPLALQILAKNSSGDIRSALMDAETLALNKNVGIEDVNKLGEREREDIIFNVLRQIFRAETYNGAKSATRITDLTPDMLKKWVEENIPREYKKNGDLARAFERLSRADIFDGRIMRRMHYGFMKYSIDLVSAGVALSKEEKYRDFVNYQFPSNIRKLSKSLNERRLKEGIGEKMQKFVHGSKKHIVVEDLPYLVYHCSNDKKYCTEIVAKFQLNDKETAYLMNTKPDTKKVKDVLVKAEIMRKEYIGEKIDRSGTVFDAPKEKVKKVDVGQVGFLKVKEEKVKKEEKKIEEDKKKKEEEKEKQSQTKLFSFWKLITWVGKKKYMFWMHLDYLIMILV